MPAVKPNGKWVSLGDFLLVTADWLKNGVAPFPRLATASESEWILRYLIDPGTYQTKLPMCSQVGSGAYSGSESPAGKDNTYGTKKCPVGPLQGKNMDWPENMFKMIFRQF